MFMGMGKEGERERDFATVSWWSPSGKDPENK